MVSDIVTRWPPGTVATDKTRFVTRLCAWSMPDTTWYTQVLPTATGNGIDPAGTNEFEVALGVPEGELELAAAEGDPPDEVPPDELPPGGSRRARGRAAPGQRDHGHARENRPRGSELAHVDASLCEVG